MSCDQKHTYEVYDELAPDSMYRGSSVTDAADKLRPLNHSPDFSSGAFVMATHTDGTFCIEATKDAERRATIQEA